LQVRRHTAKSWLETRHFTCKALVCNQTLQFPFPSDLVTRENGLLWWCITCNRLTEKLCPSRGIRLSRLFDSLVQSKLSLQVPLFLSPTLARFRITYFLIGRGRIVSALHEEQGWLRESVREFGGEPSSAEMEASLRLEWARDICKRRGVSPLPYLHTSSSAGSFLISL
jgi:hypothetical protein